MRTSSFSRASAAIVVAVSVLTVAAGPAWSVVRDVDQVKISAGKADFGRGPHKFGAPETPGRLSFDDRSSTIRVTLAGTVYWDDPFSGGCALVRMRLYSESGALLKKVDSKMACRVGGMHTLLSKVPQKDVTVVAAHLSTHKVVITTRQSASKNSPFHNVASVTRYYGEVNGILD